MEKVVALKVLLEDEGGWLGEYIRYWLYARLWYGEHPT